MRWSTTNLGPTTNWFGPSQACTIIASNWKRDQDRQVLAQQALMFEPVACLAAICNAPTPSPATIIGG